MVEVPSQSGLVHLTFNLVGPRSRSNLGSIASALRAALRRQSPVPRLPATVLASVHGGHRKFWRRKGELGIECTEFDTSDPELPVENFYVRPFAIDSSSLRGGYRLLSPAEAAVPRCPRRTTVAMIACLPSHGSQCFEQIFLALGVSLNRS